MKTNRNISISLNTLFSLRKGKGIMLRVLRVFIRCIKRNYWPLHIHNFAIWGHKKQLESQQSNPLQELWLVTFPDNILSWISHLASKMKDKYVYHIIYTYLKFPISRDIFPTYYDNTSLSLCSSRYETWLWWNSLACFLYLKRSPVFAIT